MRIVDGQGLCKNTRHIIYIVASVYHIMKAVHMYEKETYLVDACKVTDVLLVVSTEREKTKRLL